MSRVEYGHFLSAVHRSTGWKNLGEKIRQGTLLDNTAQVKEENDRAIAALLEDIRFHYGYEPIFLHPDTVVTIETSALHVTFNPHLALSVCDGKINAVGVCQTEAFVKANLLNGTTMHNGSLARAVVYQQVTDSPKDPTITHVRASLSEDALASKIPIEQIDSSTTYRTFQPNGKATAVNNLDYSGYQLGNDTATLIIQGEIVDLDVLRTKTGEIVHINGFSSWGNTIGEDESGDVTIAVKKTERHDFIVFKQDDRASSWIVIDRKNKDAPMKIIHYSHDSTPSPGCQIFAELVKARLKT